MSASTAYSSHDEVPVAPVTQARVIHSEWIKMRSLRSTTLTLLAAIVAMVGLAALVGATTNSHWTRMDLVERLRFNAVDRSLAGVHLAQLAIGVLGVLMISGEYATGMVRATLSAVPRRLPVLWAKAVLYAGVTFVLMLGSSLAAFVVGQHFLASHGTDLSAPHAWRAIVGTAGYLTIVALLALSLGFIIRSTAGGIATLFGLLLVLPGIMLLLPTDWQTHTTPYLPSNAGESLYRAGTLDPNALSPTNGLLVLLVWVVVGLAAAAMVLERRDA